MIRKQEVVKHKQGPAQGPTRSIHQFVRSHDVWVVFPQETREVVEMGDQGIRKGVRREQDRPRFFVSDRERGNDRDNPLPRVLGLNARTIM